MVKISKLIGHPVCGELVAKVAKCITSPKKVRTREEEISKLKKEVADLKTQVTLREEDARAAREMANIACKAAEIIRGTMGSPGEAVAKA